MTTPLPFLWPYSLVFWLVYTWAFLPEIRIVRRATSSGPVPAEDRGSLRLVLAGSSAAFLAALVLPLFVPRAALPGRPFAWFLLGVLILVAGSLLRRHCFRVLGTFFTGAVTIQAGHQVVETGAYRWVRHPSYSGALLMVLGAAISGANWLGLSVSFVIAYAAYSYRARVEEKALLAALGEPYARFLATRGRFLPFP